MRCQLRAIEKPLNQTLNGAGLFGWQLTGTGIAQRGDKRIRRTKRSRAGHACGAVQQMAFEWRGIIVGQFAGHEQNQSIVGDASGRGHASWQQLWSY